MKNAPFIPLTKQQSAGLLPDLTTYLVFDSETKDFYFEPTHPLVATQAISDIITSEKIIASLKQSGLISPRRRKLDKILLKHQNTGHELAIDCSHEKIKIESYFSEPCDMPVSYITDVCDLFTEVIKH